MTRVKKLSHLDKSGRAAMVDVSAKGETARRAMAEGFVVVNRVTLAAISGGTVAKGEVLAVARVAGILAAKRTGELIPLCHPLGLDWVGIAFEVPEKVNKGEGRIRVVAVAGNTGKTGVEMECLVAVSVACLTIYDMCKAVQKDIRIEGVRLLSKSGGKSGEWRVE